MKKRTVMILAIVAVLLFVLVYGFFDPTRVSFFPKCPFHQLTGLQCPGCGSQRALHQLLHLNIAGAFHYNALMVLCIPLIGFLLFAELFATRFPRLHQAAHNTWFSWGILAIVLLWWLLRNIFGW